MEKKITLIKTILVFLSLVIFPIFGCVIVTAESIDINDIVQVQNVGTLGLNVRQTPAGDEIGEKYDGDRGIVVDGPQYAYYGGVLFKWWKVLWQYDDLIGWSAEYYPNGVTYLIDVPPVAPTLISPGSSDPPGANLGTLTPTFQWTESYGADSYALAISEYPYGPGNVFYNPQHLYGTSHTIPSGILETGKLYRWQMQAWHSSELSPLSNILYFQITNYLTITFYTYPYNIGAITFNGNFYTAGQSIQVPYGTYNIVAFPSSGYSFNSWSSTCGSISNQYSISTTISVITSGYLMAFFETSPYYQINFQTVSSEGGGIYWASSNQIFYNGQSTLQFEGSHYVYAEESSGYYFTHWSSTGGITVDEPYSESTGLSVSGSGTLTAWFMPFGEHMITLLWTFDCGEMTFNGVRYNWDEGLYGKSLGVNTGVYPIVATPLIYFVFNYWTTTGGLSVADPYDESTTVSVSGPGTLTMHLLNRAIPECSPWEIDFGTHFSGWTESQTFEIWSSGYGTLIYTFSENIPWITISPSSGSSTGEHDVITISVINTDTMSGYFSDYIEIWYDDNTRAIAMGVYITIQGDNQPPEKPNIPWGPSGLKVGEVAIYKTNTGDNDGDQIYYWFDWGDGTNSNWIGPYDSGRIIDGVSHSWEELGHYYIKVKAKDEHNAESAWSDAFLIVIADPFYFVHITDIHSFGISFGNDEWVDAVEEIATWNPPPKFVICTGDLVDWGHYGDLNYDGFIEPLHGSKPNFFIDESENIPIYFCPGNHDSYPEDWFPMAVFIKSFDTYYDRIGSDYTFVKKDNYAIFSLNSGTGSDCVPPTGDGLDDKYGSEVTNFQNDIESLPDWYNVRLVMTHNPYISNENEGLFNNNREIFFNLCKNKNVDSLLCGHLHGLDQIQPILGTNTLQVNTNGFAKYSAYRKILVESDGRIYPQKIDYFTDKNGGGAWCNVEVHIYDNQGNHNGPNETGEIEHQIPKSYYSHWNFINDSLGINDTFTEFSCEKNDSIDYTYIIKSLSNDAMNLSLFTSIIGGGMIKVNYLNVAINENSIATFYANKSKYDYTLNIDNNGDGIVDMEIQPNEIICIELPYSPAKPSGPIIGYSNIAYNYITNTTDPENDQICYLFDWGDDTDSEWLGPFDSEETCSASHSWISNGIYNVKVRAKDSECHISEWSNTLTVIIDDISPTTTKTISNPKYGIDKEWVTSFTEFNLTASDVLSGIDSTYYRIWYNGIWTPWNEYTGNFTLTGEEKHYLEYYSVDYAGNIEETHNQTHYVDDSPPVVTISASPNSLWPPNHKMKNVLISGSATDAGSGIASVTFAVVDEYDLVEPTITGFGQTIQLQAMRYGYDMNGRTYTITATATDNLGHIATSSTIVRVPHDQGN